MPNAYSQQYKADYQAEHQALEAIVRSAGQMIRSAFHAPERTAYTLKGQQDYLTLTDAAVERMVRSEIARYFPGDAVLGEEEGGAIDAQRLWIVDPVDGTANFARHIPHCCISLAFMHHGQTQVGAIYAPMHDELFIAERGHGAWCNGRRMAVSAVDDLRQASVEIGWSARMPEHPYLDWVGSSLRAGCSVRRAGSGALGLAYVADGRSEAYMEAHINAWDVAAGLLLVQEAGGHVNNFWANNGLGNGNPVLACNAPLVSALQQLSGLVD